MGKELSHFLLILNFPTSDLDYLTHIFNSYILLLEFSKNTFTYAFLYDIISFSMLEVFHIAHG